MYKAETTIVNKHLSNKYAKFWSFVQYCYQLSCWGGRNIGEFFYLYALLYYLDILL